MIVRLAALLHRQPGFQGVTIYAQHIGAVVFAHDDGIDRLRVGDQPDPFDALPFLALRQPQLLHGEQLLLARLLAIGRTGLQHHPLALELRQRRRLAVQLGYLQLGFRYRILARVDQRAIVVAPAGLDDVVRHIRGDDGKGAHGHHGQQLPAAGGLRFFLKRVREIFLHVDIL